jgi:hypothetical protein
MKVRDVVVENVIDDMLEEGGDEYENAALLTILSYLQNRAADTHKQPRIRADSLINLVQQAGHPQFNYDTLVNIAKNNDRVKNIIKDIKDVTVSVQDGKVNVGGGGTELVKYVYIEPVAQDDEDLDPEADAAPKTAPEKTVDSMAKRAAKARPEL